MARHNEVGRWGEELAADYLVEHGYAICECNWHVGSYEIDIIAMRDDVLVFVEVKTRTNIDEDPLEAIDRRKILYMARAAQAYLLAKNLPHRIQFDLFAISGTPDNYKLEHLPDAFDVPAKTYR